MMTFDDGAAELAVALVNRATVDPGVDPGALAAALQVQAGRDAAVAWGLPRVIVEARPDVPAGWWGLVLLDDADQAGALGYHDLTPAGLPQGKVFVRTTQADRESVSMTASHELLEMLVDPAINCGCQGDDGAWYALEICDPCEAVGYEIDGVTVSDFVYPAWFEPFRAGAVGIKFNFLDTIRAPFELLEGGYIGVYRRGGWVQVFGSPASRARFNPRRKRRAMRRARPSLNPGAGGVA